MRVLLVHPRINYDNMEPLGLLSLASTLVREGHTARVLDVFPHDDEYFADQVRCFAPEVIGFSFETPGVARARELRAIAASIAAHAVVCAGGVHASTLPEKTLRDLFLDFVMVGESEESFCAVCRALETKKEFRDLPGVASCDANGVFQCNPSAPLINNLDSLPVIDRTLLHGYRFYFEPPGCIRGMVFRRSANIMASRGCPHLCTFCQSGQYMGSRVRMRSVNHVLAEIDALQREYDIHAFMFVDDSLTSDKEWLFEFCEKIKCRTQRISWGCQSRADRISVEVVRAMKEAGCVQIDLGIESGDPHILQILKKGEALDQMCRAAACIHDGGIRLLCSFIVGSPGETRESIDKTILLIKQLRPNISQYFTLVPYPGTALAQSLSALGSEVLLSFDQHGSQKQWESGFIPGALSAREQVGQKLRLQRSTFLRDYSRLVFEWLKYPEYLPKILRTIVMDPHFRAAIGRDLLTNPVAAVQNAYHCFNRSLLASARAADGPGILSQKSDTLRVKG